MLSKSQVKYIQSLGHKKQRDADAVFIAEGPKIVNEWLTPGLAKIIQLYAVQEWLDANPSTAIATTFVTPDELAKISQLQTANQVLAIVKKWEQPAVINTKGSIVLALDKLQDPGNLGTIIRIADWFGIADIVCTMDTAEIYNPKVVQGTMGSLARVNVSYLDLPVWLSTQRVPIYAAALDGEHVANIGKIKEGVVVIGNESKGVSAETFKLVSKRITIPGKGHAESLNAAVATGIVLSHLVG